MISSLAGLLIAEVGLRAMNYRPGLMDPEMYVAHANQLLPYKLRANYEGYCAGREVTTDSNGNRRVVPSYGEVRKKQSPERVVLLLGDSGVFGFGLADTDTIGSQLQRISFENGLNYEVRNIGVSGYTSWNEYQALNEYLSSQSATDVVLLYMPNDLTFDNDYFGIGRGKRATFDRGASEFHHYTKWIYSHLYFSYLLVDSAKRVKSQLRSQTLPNNADILDPLERQDELNYSMEALRQIRKICDEKGINLRVGIYRDLAYFDNSERWLNYEDVISKKLDQSGIKWFIAKSHTDQFTLQQAHVTWNDPHPSAAAAGLIAADILMSLR